MEVAYWFLLIAGLMPYGLVQLARKGGVSNNNPRDGYAALTDARAKRAYAAHQNSFEVFPFFAVAVLVALQAGYGTWILNVLCLLWLATRGVYIYAYLNDRASLRSAVFGAGLLVVLAIITIPLWAPYPTYFSE